LPTHPDCWSTPHKSLWTPLICKLITGVCWTNQTNLISSQLFSKLHLWCAHLNQFQWRHQHGHLLGGGGSKKSICHPPWIFQKLKQRNTNNNNNNKNNQKFKLFKRKHSFVMNTLKWSVKMFLNDSNIIYKQIFWHPLLEKALAMPMGSIIVHIDWYLSDLV
jgi:hypothetical protein